jgi:hypothetical protein
MILLLRRAQLSTHLSKTNFFVCTKLPACILNNLTAITFVFTVIYLSPSKGGGLTKVEGM